MSDVLEATYEEIHKAADVVGDFANYISIGRTVGDVLAGVIGAATVVGCAVCGEISAKYYAEVLPQLNDIVDFCQGLRDALNLAADSLEAADGNGAKAIADAAVIAIRNIPESGISIADFF